MILQKYGSRNWAVYDEYGQLICVTVYKKGAMEVMRRLSNAAHGFASVKSSQENDNKKY